MEILYLLFGIILGAASIYFIQKSKISILTGNLQQFASQSEKIQVLGKENKELFGQTKADKSTIDSLKDQIKVLDQNRINLEKNLKQTLTDITNDSFIQQGKLLSDQQNEKLNIILNPLKEKIKDFEAKVTLNQTESVKTNTSLMEQIKNLTNLNQTITQKTEDLTNALRGSNKAQGGWGEMILERVLESSGLKKGSEYETQFNTQNANQETIRPDAVIFLPDNKNIVIDSKVSLVAYEQYASTEESVTKETALKAHILSLKSHIKLLSEKDYHTSLELNSPDFTLLFIPIESGFAISVKDDSSIFEYAWAKKIVLVSPSTLLATLRTIASVWKNENQTRNAVEIAQKAGDMYDKFAAFTDDLDNIGKAIGKSNEAYENALNKLSRGKGNLLNRAEQLKTLGVKAGKNISSRIVTEEN